MTSPLAIRYPLDLTGINPVNLVRNEPQSLLSNQFRAIVPDYGPFFTKGLIITDLANNQVLVPHTQYTCCELIQDATTETGLEVMGVILIIDQTVSANVELTYQVLGGQYSYSTDALINMLATLQLDDRAVQWGQIIGIPSAFPPTQHLHDLGDTYGWQFVVDALDNVRQALLIGSSAASDSILATFTGLLDAHIADHANPHAVTATQIGLGNVQNYGIASQADVATGTRADLYVTPFSMALALAGSSGGVGAALTAHIADQTNPHAVTATQVGLGSVQNYGISSQVDAEDGTVNNFYMTPLRVAQAITAQASSGSIGTTLAAHIADHANPHATTADQVGAYTTAQVDATIAAVNAAVALKDDTTAVNTALALKADTTTVNTELALKADVGAGVNFSSVSIGPDLDVLLYQYITGGLGFRTGLSGSFVYSHISPTGGMTIPGQMVAGGGFLPSDMRLKNNIVTTEARAWWREIDFKQWHWNDGNPFGHNPDDTDVGYVAQDVQKVCSQYVTEFEIPQPPESTEPSVKYLAIDKAGLAMEMAAASGQAVDALQERIDILEAQVVELMRLLKGE
jgi:hypothetical protein